MYFLMYEIQIFFQIVKFPGNESLMVDKIHNL